MRNRQIHSALDGVVLILSALLFCLLSCISCKSEVKPSSTPLPPPPLGRSAPQTAGMAAPASIAPAEAQPVEGGVEGGVPGGVVGGVVGGVLGTNGLVVPAPPASSPGSPSAATTKATAATSLTMIDDAERVME